MSANAAGAWIPPAGSLALSLAIGVRLLRPGSSARTLPTGARRSPVILVAAISTGAILSGFAFAYELAHAGNGNSVLLADANAAGHSDTPNVGYFFLTALSLGISAGLVGIKLASWGLVVAFAEMLLSLGAVVAVGSYVTDKLRGGEPGVAEGGPPGDGVPGNDGLGEVDPERAHEQVAGQMPALLGQAARGVPLTSTGRFTLGEPSDYTAADAGLRRPRSEGDPRSTAALVVLVPYPGQPVYEHLRAYAAHGVEEIVIISPEEREVQWFRWTRGTYAPVRRSRLIPLGPEELRRRIVWP